MRPRLELATTEDVQQTQKCINTCPNKFILTDMHLKLSRKYQVCCMLIRFSKPRKQVWMSSGTDVVIQDTSNGSGNMSKQSLWCAIQ